LRHTIQRIGKAGNCFALEFLPIYATLTPSNKRILTLRRADRLYQITQILRNKRLITAKQLGERLQVSERTIYRDIQDLSLSGVPILSEPGIGYQLRHSLDIPPIMFNSEEIEAILLGTKILKAWTGKETSQAAQSALDKIEAVLPSELKNAIYSSKLFVPDFEIPKSQQRHFDSLRQAINKKRLVDFEYQKINNEISQRQVKPLGLYYWGKVWTLVAWCNLREGFRVFRVDRIIQFKMLSETFLEVQGQALNDYIAEQERRYAQYCGSN
jgi:predicted DNA-binding transcriptional regulator YafY